MLENLIKSYIIYKHCPVMPCLLIFQFQLWSALFCLWEPVWLRGARQYSHSQNSATICNLIFPSGWGGRARRRETKGGSYTGEFLGSSFLESDRKAIVQRTKNWKNQEEIPLSKICREWKGRGQRWDQHWQTCPRSGEFCKGISYESGNEY